MKVIKILMFLVVISILTSIFMLTSCECGAKKEMDSAVDIMINEVPKAAGIDNFKSLDVKITDNRFYPSVIEVDQGDKVELKITSDDNSGFELKEFDLNTIVPKDMQVKLYFTADNKGEFTFTCGNYCVDITEDFGDLCEGEDNCPEDKEDADVLGTRLLKGKVVVN